MEEPDLFTLHAGFLFQYLVVIGFLVLVSAPAAADWPSEIVRDSGKPGQYFSMAGGPSNTLHVAWVEESTGSLMYATKTADAWSCETVSDTGNVEREVSITVGANNWPHISFYDNQTGLRYATRTSSGWHVDTVEANPDIGYYSSITLDKSYDPVISYVSLDSSHSSDIGLKYASLDGSTWKSVLVDNGLIDFTSIAVNPVSGKSAISYRAWIDDENGTSIVIKYAEQTTSGWVNETITDSIGRCSLVFNHSGGPYIAYTSGGSQYLSLASKAGSIWTNQTIDSDHALQSLVSAAWSNESGLVMAYKADSGAVRYAYQVYGKWFCDQVISDGGWGSIANPSVILDSESSPHILYYRQNGPRLLHAYLNSTRPANDYLPCKIKENVSHMTGATVNGTMTGSFSLSDIMVATITNGSFTGNGLFTGNYTAIVDSTTCSGTLCGVAFWSPDKDRFVMEGALKGDLSGTLHASCGEFNAGPASTTDFVATSDLILLQSTGVSANISINGTLVLDEMNVRSLVDARAKKLMTTITPGGDYSDNLTVMVNGFEIPPDAGIPLAGRGAYVLTITGQAGSADGYASGEYVIGDGMVLSGVTTDPYASFLSGYLNEENLRKPFSLTLYRLDKNAAPTSKLTCEVSAGSKVAVGRDITYYLRLQNTGLLTARNVTIRSELPGQVGFLEAFDGGVFDIPRHLVSWDLGDITPGGSRQVTYRGRTRWGIPLGTNMTTIASVPRGGDPEVPIDENYHSSSSVVLDEDNEFRMNNNITSGLTGETLANISLGLTMSQGDTDICMITDFSESSDGYFGQGNMDSTFLNEYGELQLVHEDMQVTLPPQTEVRSGWYNMSRIHVTLSKYPYYQPAMVDYKEREGFFDWMRTYKDDKGAILLDEQRINECSVLNKGRLLVMAGFDSIFKLSNGKLPKALDIWLVNFWEKSLIEFESEIGCKIIHYQTGIDPPANWRENLQLRFEYSLIYYHYYKEYLESISETTESSVSVTSTSHDPNILYGPDGVNVTRGQLLDYRVEFENTGEVEAYGVFMIDYLDGNLDPATLSIGPVYSVSTGSVIAGPGTYNSVSNIVTWKIGTVEAGDGGYANVSARVKSTADDESTIINRATVFFPSVPEKTPTNPIVSVVRESGIVAPVANFTFSPENGIPGIPITFLDTSTGDPVSWNWSLDGGTSWTHITNQAERNITRVFDAAGSYSVILEIENNEGKTSKAEQVITIPQPTLSIGTINPGKGIIGNSVSAIITGTDFTSTPVMRVNLTRGYEVIPATNIKVTGNRKISCTFVIPLTVSNGSWNLTVRKPDGSYGWRANAFTTRTFNEPKISSINPKSALRNGTTAFALSGTNFISGSEVTFSNSNHAITAVLDPITKTTKITGNLTTNTSSPLGTWNISIVLPDGGSVVKTGAFTLKPWTNPIVSTIKPTSGYPNMTYVFAINGNLFQDPGTMVTLTRGVPGDTITASITTVTPKKISGTLHIPSGTVAGNWNLLVTTPDGGTTTKNGVFTVKSWPAPRISTFTPTTASNGTSVAFTLSGINFQPGSHVTLTNASAAGLNFTASIDTLTQTKVNGTMHVPANAIGKYGVEVTCPDGKVATKDKTLTIW